MDILDVPIGASSPMEFDPRASSYQRSYYEALLNTSDNIQLNARAGSGKSTTLTQGAKYLTGESLLLCFNKSNQEELAIKVKGYAQAKTFNGLGNGLFWKFNRSAVLNAKKIRDAVRTHLGEGSETYRDFGGAVVRAVSLMKNNAFGVEQGFEVPEISELFDSYDLGVPEDKLLAMSQVAGEVFLRTNRDYSQFDFDDQLYQPIAMGWDFKPFTNVLVDEDQDLSPIQHLMLQRLSDQGSRILGVGDDRQAIYGFRGALSNSVERLEQRFAMKRFPLPICYRCPQRVIAEAQAYVPDIEAAPGAIVGSVLYRSEDYTSDPQVFPSETLVLSRTNAPLFKCILYYIRNRLPCRVTSNFLESFQGFIRGFKVELCSDLRVKLKEWFEKERASAEKKGFRGRIAELTDKYETADLLAKEFKRVYEILSLLEQLSKSTSGTRFSTIHGAKGTEADDVYILRPDTLPSPFASTREQLVQEANLIYVAITRARQSLTWGVSQK